MPSSTGDIFCHSFKLMGLGPLIGKRTWGGVIGINPSHKLVDGMMTIQPEYSFWGSGSKTEDFASKDASSHQISDRSHHSQLSHYPFWNENP